VSLGHFGECGVGDGLGVRRGRGSGSWRRRGRSSLGVAEEPDEIGVEGGLGIAEEVAPVVAELGRHAVE